MIREGVLTSFLNQNNEYSSLLMCNHIWMKFHAIKQLLFSFVTSALTRMEAWAKCMEWIYIDFWRSSATMHFWALSCWLIHLATNCYYDFCVSTSVKQFRVLFFSSMKSLIFYASLLSISRANYDSLIRPISPLTTLRFPLFRKLFLCNTYLIRNVLA